MKNQKTIRSFLGVLCLAGILLPSSVLAQYRTGGSFSQESPAVFRSVRALGMGNARIALPGNQFSPFYNPAGLNDIEKGKFYFLNPAVEFSQSTFGLIGDVSDLIDDLDAAATDAAKVDVLDQFVQARYGEFNHMRVGMNLITYARKNFAAGAVFEERLTLSFRDQTLPQFDVRNITDIILFASGSYNFWEKLLQVGLTMKPMFRTSVNESVDATLAINEEVDDVFLTLAYPHFGIGFDLGLKSDLSLPFLMDIPFYKRLHEYLKPAMALTWQDMGNTPFKVNLRDTDGHESGVEDPNQFVTAASREPIRNEQSVSFGMAVSPKILFIETNASMEFRDLNQDGSFASKFHVGVEAKFPVLVTARIGVSQGYFAGGVGLDLWVVTLDFATYGEEVGAFNRQGGNRRYAFMLNFGI